MRNQSFNYSSLARCLLPSDFYEIKELSKDDYREKIITTALSIAEKGFSGTPPIKTLKNGKPIYSTATLPERLVLRRCVQNIKENLRVKIKARGQTAEEIKSHLREGTEYNIYRFDIESFFESISHTGICQKIKNIDQLSTHTKNLINDYLENFNQHWGVGIPRGIEISPIISELVLQDFDWRLKSHPEALYYTRFVDDILVITTTKDSIHDFISWVTLQLPIGLKFNKTKSKAIKIPKRNKAGQANIITGKKIGELEFLGYHYTIIDSPLPIDKAKDSENVGSAKALYREIRIDISKSKIKKIKTKISRAIYNYKKNNDFALLKDRIAFLTSNRELIAKDKSRKIPTGIYYNYSKIDPDSPSLKELDKFLLGLVTSRRGRLHSSHPGSLSNTEKAILAKYKFELGFKGRNHKRFSPDRLKEITKIWM